MFNNYLKIAIRNLLRNKVYSFVNIAGLAMGIAAFLLILEYVSFEKSVNAFHQNSPNIYRLLSENEQGNTWQQTEPGWVYKAKQNFPEIKSYCRVADGVAKGIVVVEENHMPQSFRESNVVYAEGNFFSFFTFPLTMGKASAFGQPNVVFVSETQAKKYFGKSNPMGRTITFHNQFGKTNYTVQGVYADMPINSDWQFDLIFSLKTLEIKANLNGNGWADVENIDSQYIDTYFELQAGTNYLATEQKLRNLRKQLKDKTDNSSFRLQPLANIHLGASLSDTRITNGSLSYIYMLGGIALLILVIAWFNYINLSTAASLKRANEVGVRKVIGATQGNLIGQFLGESLLMNLCGFAFAIILVMLLQPLFNDLIGKKLSVDVLGNTAVFWLGLALILGGSLAAGAYTSFVLSSFKPIQTLKGAINKSAKGALLRKSLVVAQFTISIVLIVATMVIYYQLQFMQKQNLGVNMNQVAVIRGPEIGKDSTYKTKKSAFLNQMSQLSFVKKYATTGSVPGNWYNFITGGFTHAGSQKGDEKKNYSFAIVDNRYFDLYEIPVIAGRNFTQEECSREWNKVNIMIVNEKTAKELGFKSAAEAVNKSIQWDERPLQIVGVTKDYHHSGLKQAIDPIIFYPQSSSEYISVRLTADNMQSKMNELEKLFKNSFAGNPFEFFFVDENYNKQYQTEQQYGLIFTVASAWAIFIACLGLFGLATYTVEQKTKEIGIRKVLGASASQIVSLLSKDFLKLVMFSIVLATPLAWWAAQKWLQDFAYRIDVSWWIFVVAGISAMVVAFLTVGYQALKAASANPVKSLRTE